MGSVYIGIVNLLRNFMKKDQKPEAVALSVVAMEAMKVQSCSGAVSKEN
jgi:hypothetical protein